MNAAKNARHTSGRAPRRRLTLCAKKIIGKKFPLSFSLSLSISLSFTFLSHPFFSCFFILCISWYQELKLNGREGKVFSSLAVPTYVYIGTIQPSRFFCSISNEIYCRTCPWKVLAGTRRPFLNLSVSLGQGVWD